MKIIESGITYSFSPVHGDIGTVNIGRAPILEVLETRIARLLEDR